MTPEELTAIRSEHSEWRGGGHCATCVDDDGTGHAGSAPFPCLPARLLAHLDAIGEAVKGWWHPETCSNQHDEAGNCLDTDGWITGWPEPASAILNQETTK